MLLFAGLGNPGAKYARTRHNLGFLVADEIARRHSFQAWRSRHRGLVARGRLGREDVLMFKPTTFMNQSGEAVADAMRFYKLTPADVTVIYDEIDLNPGKVRVKIGGGAAGHNGVRSVESHIGNGFRRIRIGIGRPDGKDQVEGYVLHDFYRQEMTWLTPLLCALADAVPLITDGNDQAFLNRIALSTKPPRTPKSSKSTED